MKTRCSKHKYTQEVEHWSTTWVQIVQCTQSSSFFLWKEKVSCLSWWYCVALPCLTLFTRLLNHVHVVHLHMCMRLSAACNFYEDHPIVKTVQTYAYCGCSGSLSALAHTLVCWYGVYDKCSYLYCTFLCTCMFTIFRQLIYFYNCF